MYALRKCGNYKSIIKCVRLYSLARKNHYEVLRLRKNCSDKEIKEAFIQMSKKYHPDKNKDAKAQEKFVQIVEAYNVLSKPSSRAQYDNLTEVSSHGKSYSTYSYVYRPSPYMYKQSDSNFYNTQKNSYNNNNNNQSTKNAGTDEKTDSTDYYGFAGIKKVPNYYIIGICCSIAIIGVILQVYFIRNMYMSQRKQAQERSKLLADELERVRTTARDNGNELQTRLLLDKIVANANPTVATASLGQSLVDDKKDDINSFVSEYGVGTTDGWYDSHGAMKVNLNEVIRKIITYIELPK